MLETAFVANVSDMNEDILVSGLSLSDRFCEACLYLMNLEKLTKYPDYLDLQILSCKREYLLTILNQSKTQMKLKHHVIILS